MALGVTWGGARGGFADTEIDFGFYGGEHTVAIRFLLGTPRAYAGPFLTTAPGNGMYWVGQADFTTTGTLLGIDMDPQSAGVQGPEMVGVIIQLGGAPTVTLPLGIERRWHHLAIARRSTRSGHVFTFHLDGDEIEAASIPANPDAPPTGQIRLGRGANPPPMGRGEQFYGLLDDLAVFDKALTRADIADLARSRLTGSEPELVAGYVFGTTRPNHRKLAGTLALAPGASPVEVTNDRNADLDWARIPLPLNEHMLLPFARGDEWRCTQGWGRTKSHKGYAAFAWDFVRDGAIGGSANEPIYSSSEGTIEAIRHVLDNSTENFVTVDQGNGERLDYLHMPAGSSRVRPGEILTFHETLAEVGNSGAIQTNPHLHIAITNLGQPAKNDANMHTIPCAFSNYEVKGSDGEWRRVVRGIPRTDEIVRRPVNDGPLLFVSSWIEGTASGEQVLYGATRDQVREMHDQLADHSLSQLRVSTIDDVPIYTAIWHHGDHDDVRFGLSADDVIAANAEPSRHVACVTVRVAAGTAVHDVVVRAIDRPLRFSLGESFGEFQDRFAHRTGEGLRLASLSLFAIGADTKVTAVWRNGDDDDTAFFLLDRRELRRQARIMRREGRYLAVVAARVLDDVRYSGVFRRRHRTHSACLVAMSEIDIRSRRQVVSEYGLQLAALEPAPAQP